jgi:hypothetical protein
MTSSSASSSLMRMGLKAGIFEPMRTVPTWGMAAKRRRMDARRSVDSTSGSPPVSSTSVISSCRATYSKAGRMSWTVSSFWRMNSRLRKQ